jgi:hypothetical protein
MEGYEVITSDEHKLGHVVGRIGDNLIVEHGTIFKSRNALPRAFAEIDEAAGVVRTTIPKEILESSPKVHDGELDERAVAEHYGLASGFDSPATAGYGDLNPDDPAWTADDDARAAGLETATEQRARIHSHMGPGEGPNDAISSPGITGGDRYRDAKGT